MSLYASLVTALAPGPALDETVGRILDAAEQEFLANGVRKTSVDAIARRAGIGRVTIYRRLGDKEGLIRAVVLRQCARLLEEVHRAAARGTTVDDRLALGFVAMLRAMRGRTFFAAWLKQDPDEILRAVTVDAETALRLAISLTAQQIRLAQGAGELPPYDAEPVAEILVRLAHSFILSERGGMDLRSAPVAHAFARAHLAPLLLRGPAVPERSPRRLRDR